MSNSYYIHTGIGILLEDRVLIYSYYAKTISTLPTLSLLQVDSPSLRLVLYQIIFLALY